MGKNFFVLQHFPCGLKAKLSVRLELLLVKKLITGWLVGEFVMCFAVSIEICDQILKECRRQVDQSPFFPGALTCECNESQLDYWLRIEEPEEVFINAKQR